MLGTAVMLGALPIVAAAAPPPAPAEPPPIVVEGKRDARTLAGGEWEVAITRAHYFGPALADPNASRPAGADKTWRFCLGDTDVEALVRLLIGEGRSQSAGTTQCSKLVSAFAPGRMTARQMCRGGTIEVPNPLGGRPQLRPAQNRVTAMGRFDAETFSIGFDSRRAPIVPPEPPISARNEPSLNGGVYGRSADTRRWSVSGRRIGDCAAAPAAR